MIIFFDTSFLVEIERKNQNALKLAETFVKQDHKLLISTITVSEIMYGAYLRKDSKSAVFNAKQVLNQFQWFPFEGMSADRTAQIMSVLALSGQIIEFQDVAIAATVMSTGADYIITENKSHFDRILKSKVLTIEDALKIFK